MSETIKIGPLWNRTVFDPKGRTIKFRLRTVARYDDVKQLRMREYIAFIEEEQGRTVHPEVQTAPRNAELWIDTRDGRSVLAAELDQAGLLLASAAEAARQLGVPLVTERTVVEAGGGTGPARAA